jgi:hypothetical protein
MIVPTIAKLVLGAAALSISGTAVATGTPPNSHPLPSSYAPQAHSDNHVYGSPIGPAVVGQSAAVHRLHASKKQSATRAMHARPSHASRVDATVERHSADQ